MRTVVSSILFAVALACPLAVGAAEDFSDPTTLGRWITHYYKHPEPHRVADAMLAASSHGFMEGGRSTPSFMGFVAGVMSKNHPVAESLAEQLMALPEAHQQVLVMGVWYSSYPEGKPLLDQLAKSLPEHQEVVEQLLASGRPNLLDLPLEQGPWVLDALWGYFFATGDEATVIRIISALPWIEVRGDTSRLLVGGAARWSLISNAIQHESVMAICREALASQTEEIAGVLRDVIAEAEKDLREGKTG